MFTPRRVETEELLDEHDAPREDMERSLDDLRRINRYLGGTGIYRRLLARFLGTSKPPRLRILDLGTGTSDLLDSVKFDAFRIGLDFKIDHLLYRRDGSRSLRVVGDATQLPFLTEAVDVVTSAHFFHHFTPAENRQILGEALRVASRGVVVNDTRRHYAPLLFVRLLGFVRAVGRITRFDAPASVLRGYTIDEAREVAGSVPARRWEVHKAWPFRFGILLWK